MSATRKSSAFVPHDIAAPIQGRAGGQAAFCGIYGIRTTHGRIDGTGAMKMAPTFDSIGWFACGPGILRLVAGALFPQVNAPLAVSRMLLGSDAFAQADAEVRAVLRGFPERTATLLPHPHHVAGLHRRYRRPAPDHAPGRDLGRLPGGAVIYRLGRGR